MCVLCAYIRHRNPKNSDHPLNGFRISRFYLDYQRNELITTFSMFFFLLFLVPIFPNSINNRTMRADDILKLFVHRSKNHVARCQCTCNLFQFGRRWRIHCRNMQIIHVCLLLFYIWLAYGNAIRQWTCRCWIDLLAYIVRPYTCVDPYTWAYGANSHNRNHLHAPIELVNCI